MKLRTLFGLFLLVPALGAQTYITPGTGFGSKLPVPPPSGTPDQIDIKPAAHFDFPDWQPYWKSYEIGVAAQGVFDINYVQISVNGGQWAKLSNPSVSPQTGVWSYHIKLVDNSTTSGTIYPVIAIVTPKLGASRVIKSYLIAEDPASARTIYISRLGNDSNTGLSKSSPVKTVQRAFTLAKDGDTIEIITAGRYPLPSYLPGSPSNTHWITLKASKSLASTQVVLYRPIKDYTRVGVGKLHLKNLTVEFGNLIQLYGLFRKTWVDSCYVTNSKGWLYDMTFPPFRQADSGGTKLYFTETIAHDISYAFVSANLVRNCVASRISGDVFQNNKAVLNVWLDTVDGTLLQHHTDIFQYWNNVNETIDNVLVQNATCKNVKATQCLFIGQLPVNATYAFTDSAFVNIAFDGTAQNPPFSQFGINAKGILFSNIALPNQTFMFRLSASSKFRHVVLKNSIFKELFGNKNAANYYMPDGCTAENCHILQPTWLIRPKLPGKNTTTGKVDIIFGSFMDFAYTGSSLSSLFGNAAPIKIGGILFREPNMRGAFPWW